MQPALALWVDFARLDRELPASYRALIAEPVGDEQIQPHPISVADCDYFRPMIDPSFQIAPIGDAVDETKARSAELAACVA